MARQELLPGICDQIGGIIKAFRENSENIESTLQWYLRRAWDKCLFWTPTITTLQGETVDGVILQTKETSRGRRIIYLSPQGTILKNDFWQDRQELPLESYLELAPLAVRILQETREKQWQEAINAPEGRDVTWRFGETLFGLMYASGYPGDPKTITVRIKRDGLYCPRHPEEKLVLGKNCVTDGRRYISCPSPRCEIDCTGGHVRVLSNKDQ